MRCFGASLARYVRQHLIPRLGAKKLQQLRPIDVVEAERYWLTEGWRRTRAQRGLSPKSVSNIHRILRLALRHAIEWKLLSVSPIENLKAPRWERKEQLWLDLLQAKTLVEHLETTPAGTAVLVKVSTGLRMGELLGLRWRDVDLTGRAIALQQQLQWLAGKGYIMRAVKSHRSRRPISIDLDLVDVIRSYKVRQNEARLQVGDGNDVVFTNEVGQHLTPDQVRRALLRALKSAGLPRIRPHDLRHTHR
jgi:integrase